MITQIKQIDLMNDSMITYLKKIGEATQRNEIIKQILKDEACFFKIEKEDAYIILKDIGVSQEQVDSVYLKLISSDNFFDLVRKGKINENEPDLKVKYSKYNPDDLFKKSEIKYDLQNNNITLKKKMSILDKIKKFLNMDFK